MPQCIKLRRKKTQVCSGDLNRVIQIYTRTIVTPTNPYGLDVDLDEEFILVLSPWAMLETVDGQTIFNDVSTEVRIDTIFYIRVNPNIILTSEFWIEYDGNRYNIIKVTDMDANKLFWKIYTNLRGDPLREPTKA